MKYINTRANLFTGVVGTVVGLAFFILGVMFILAAGLSNFKALFLGAMFVCCGGLVFLAGCMHCVKRESLGVELRYDGMVWHEPFGERTYRYETMLKIEYVRNELLLSFRDRLGHYTHGRELWKDCFRDQTEIKEFVRLTEQFITAARQASSPTRIDTAGAGLDSAPA